MEKKVTNKYEGRKVSTEEEYYSIDGEDILSLSQGLKDFNEGKSLLYGDRFIDCTIIEKWTGYEDMEIVIVTSFYEDDETFINRIKNEKEAERQYKRKLVIAEKRRLHNEKIEREIKALKKKLK